MMLATPATDCRDWLMKFFAVTEGGDLAMTRATDEALWAEASALIA